MSEDNIKIKDSEQPFAEVINGVFQHEMHISQKTKEDIAILLIELENTLKDFLYNHFEPTCKSLIDRLKK